jgi:uncharacterized membrane protein
MESRNSGSNLESAKQATPQAIAALINRYLEPKGITAKSSFKDGCLQIMLESTNVPSQKVLVPAIRRLMIKLVTESIQKVKVYGKKTGDDFPAWNEEFELVEQIKDSVPSIDKESGIEEKVGENSSTSVELEPQTQAFTDSASSQTTLNVDAGLKKSAKQGDIAAISSLINSQLLEGIVANITSKDNCLHVVLISAKSIEKESLVERIRTLLFDLDLDLNLYHSVKIYSRKEIQGSIASQLMWIEGFELVVRSTDSNLVPRSSQNLEEVTTGSTAKTNLASERAKIEVIILEGYDFPIWRYAKQGWLLLSRNWQSLITFSVIFIVVLIALEFLESVVRSSILTPLAIKCDTPCIQFSGGYQTLKITALLIRVTFNCINLAIQTLFFAGFLNVALKKLRRKTTKLNDFLIGFNPPHLFRLALFGCVIGLLTSLPIITFVVLLLIFGAWFYEPSGWFSISFLLLALSGGWLGTTSLIFTVPLVIDYNLGSWKAMKTSLRIVQKSWLRIFAFVLSNLSLVFIAGFVVGLIISLLKLPDNLASILGLGFLASLFTCSISCAYEDVISMKATERKKTKTGEQNLTELVLSILLALLICAVVSASVVPNIVVFYLFLIGGLACIPATIATNKGYNFGVWWLYGFLLLFWIAFFHSLFLKDKNSNVLKMSNRTQLNALEQLKELKDKGIISETEFEKKKSEILDRI